MDRQVFGRTLISDDGVCRVREIEPGRLRRVGHDDRDKLDDLDGRYRFWLHGSATAAAPPPGWDPATDSSSRVYATLRVDATHAVISGDLFADIRRTVWLCSWRSEAIFVAPDPDNSGAQTDEWDLLVICDLFRPEGFVARGEVGALPPEKLTLFLRAGGQQVIGGLRLIAFDSNGNAALDLSMTENEQPVRYDSFRRLNLVNVTDIDPDADDLLSQVVVKAVGRDGAALRDALERTGSRLTDSGDEQIALRYFQPKSTIGEAAFSLLSPYQWTDDPYGYAVLLTRMDPPQDAILGTTFGLDGKEPLHRPRFGAVVYVKRLVDRYLKRRNLTAETISEEQRDDLARRVRFTYIHELGHLLNLPHTWQRDRFRMPALSADPAARSWMTYGSRYPLGDFMTLLRRRTASRLSDEQGETNAQRLQRERDLADDDAERNVSTTLAEPGFIAEELGWLWHAPFDQIASGGQYYTMQTGAPLVLSSQTSPRLSLTIWDGSQDGEGDGLRLRRRPGGEILCQPFLGEVEFRPTRAFAESYPFHMTFQSPMLTLLIRCEDTRGEFPDMLPETRRLTVPPIPLAWGDKDGNPLRDSDLTRRLHDSATVPIALVDDGPVYRATLPLVTDAFLRRFRNDWKERFTVQAVLRPYGAAPIFSNRITIGYGGGSDSYSDDEAAIMAHPQLPLLIELLSYRSNAILSDLCPPEQHSDGYAPPALKDLIDAIATVDPGPVSPRLLTYCRERLAWSADSETEAKRHLRSLDQRTEPGLIRQYLSGHEILLASYDTREQENLE